MPHLLHEMTSTRVPRRFVFLDTEAWRHKVGGIERQSWRCGVTAEVHWQSKEQRWAAPTWTDHDTPAGMWATITAAARKNCRTVVVAHNLGYDLRISDAFAMLSAYGWSLEKLVLAESHVGFDAVQGDLRLVVVDSTTVLPVGIGVLADRLDMSRPDLPDDGADPEAHLARCRADVAVLMRAYLAVVDALRSGDLGCWARTGSGIGWNTMLRRHLSRKVLVHELAEVREVERDAVMGGRAEAWRWGRLAKGGWQEWDHELAYAHVLAAESLPAYYASHMERPRLATMRATMGTYRYLVRATVETDVPVLPVRDSHGSFFPVGSFTSWWWDVELLEAEREGARVTTHEAHRYLAQPWLQTWASWVIDLCDDRSTPEARVLAIAAKHWQRAIVGRSAMRYGNWTETGDAYVSGVSYMDALDADSGARGAIFQAGGRRWESWERTWWDGALPQLLSAVSAHCRVNLWRAMRTAGLEHVAYVDTDSLIVDKAGGERLAVAVAAGELGSLRRKAALSHLTIWAPRYLTGKGYSRIAGVSGDRRLVGEHTYQASAWERLTAALSAGHGDEVVVKPVTVHMALEDWRRVHLPGGSTAPYEVLDGVRQAVERTESA